jgi:hypothetical protein
MIGAPILHSLPVKARARRTRTPTTSGAPPDTEPEA